MNEGKRRRSHSPPRRRREGCDRLLTERVSRRVLGGGACGDRSPRLVRARYTQGCRSASCPAGYDTTIRPTPTRSASWLPNLMGFSPIFMSLTL